jgi:aspartate aminotransferase
LENFPDVLIISDEIYEYILYEGEHIAFASLPNMYDRTITVNGFSKAYCMTGLRVGYMAGPLSIASQVVKIQSHVTSSTCSTSQYAALAALSLERSEIQVMVDKFKERRDFVVSQLQQIKGMEFAIPQGAFYVFADISKILAENKAGVESDTTFCIQLLEKHNIAVVPGVGFGMAGCFRISYSTSMPNLEKAMAGIRSYVAEIV